MRTTKSGKRRDEALARRGRSRHRANVQAGVMLARIAGFQLMCQMIELPALAKADPKNLVQILGPIFDRLLRKRA